MARQARNGEGIGRTRATAWRRTVSVATSAVIALAAAASIAATPARSVAIYEEAALSEGSLATVNGILDKWESVAREAGADMGSWREVFGIQFANMPSSFLKKLSSISPSGSDAKRDYGVFLEVYKSAQFSVMAQSQSRTSTLKLGSTTKDQVFVPITPCRVVDTRVATSGAYAGPIAAGTERDFYFYNVDATWNWSLQGGPNAPANTFCPGTTLTSAGGTLGNVAPSAAVATVTVVNPTAAGNFIVWGGNTSFPVTSALNWSGPGAVVANTTVIPAGGRGVGVLDFTVRYNGPSGQADVVVDVVGYFVENDATALQCTTQWQAGAGTVATNTSLQVNFPACPSGYTATGHGCGYAGSLSNNVYLQEMYLQFGYCNWRNNSGVSISATSFEAETRCCRVPGK